MQYSTTLTTKKERNKVFDLLTEQKKVHNTDLYVSCFTEKENFNLKGKIVELDSVDIGPEDRKSRIANLDQQLKTEKQQYDDELAHLDEDEALCKKYAEELQAKLDLLDQQLEEFEMTKVRKNKQLQLEYSKIAEEKEGIQTSLAETKLELDFLPDRKQLVREAFLRRQEMIDIALEQEKVILELEKEKMTEMIAKRKTLTDKIKATEDAISCTKDTPKLKDSEIRKKRIEIQVMTSELLKLNSEIYRIQNRTGSTKERYFIMKSWNDKKEDLVAFSRRYNEQSNIESEMSHKPRAEIDPQAANRLLNILVYLMGALNIVLLVSELMGYYINLFTFHTIYILVILGLYIYTNVLFRKTDKIFVAHYYSLTSRDLDITYTNEDGETKTIRVKCYSFELLLSDKMSVTDVFASTEADIVQLINQRNQGLVLKFSKIITQLEVTELALREEVQQLQFQNQVMAARYEKTYYNARADVMRDEKNIDLPKPASPWISVVNNLILILGLCGAIAIIGYAIPDEIGAEFFNITVSSGKAFFFGLILGIALTIVIIRWIQGGSLKLRKG